MPIVTASTYRPPCFLRNGHLLTIYPHLFRRVEGVAYRRRRIETPDNDFIDLDCCLAGSHKAAVIAHGLEGNSQRPYVLGMVRALNESGWDAVVWNFRGCSGEPNRKPRFYHSGDTADLDTVVEHVLESRRYSRTALVGFSLGGNIVLKYLGERGRDALRSIGAAVVFSVPCDLHGAALEMSRPSNMLYMRRFLTSLHDKIRVKMSVFPGQVDDHDYHRIRDFKDFDDRYTGPLHGFAGAMDYWEKCSSKPFLGTISIPTLLVNALDDPFLSPSCYPRDEALSNPFLTLEMPDAGGHVGFVSLRSRHYWSERRCVDFLNGNV
jgi:predicted alpha/beta-fold hydrolase